jgi:sulfide:quinone oxidoreductase
MPEARFAPQAMAVAAPFGRGAADTLDWLQITQEQGAELVLDSLIAVDTQARCAYTSGGRRMPYDALVVAVGARHIAPLRGTLTFGSGDDAGSLRALVADLIAGTAMSVAFALPSPSSWPLPLYELALLAADELHEYGCAAAVRLVTPEREPLAVFGAAGAEAIEPLLEARGIELVTCAQPRDVVAGGIRLQDGGFVPADRVVTVGEIAARPVAGLPLDSAGFLPTDAHGRVVGEPAVYAAGEVTSFPLRQGGLATQQADAVAEAIAALCGGDDEPAPFRPVLRGRLLTSGAPLYLQARPSGQSLASTRPLWSPPGKIAGRYLAPYLASARPSRLGASPLAERRPVAGDEHDAVTLALWLAEAEARAGNAARARQAYDAAATLEPARHPITAR